MFDCKTVKSAAESKENDKIIPQCSLCSLRLIFCILEKSNCVAKSYPASYFGREIFDKRQVIAVKLIGQVIGVKAENMRVMLSADGV